MQHSDEINTKEIILKMLAGAFVFMIALTLICGLFFGIGYLWRSYNVWASGMQGKAELQQADWNRQIIVREAQAKAEAAIDLANAEVNRAKGVALANKIIGDSLRDNEAYLRYLWINNLQNEHNQVIYVPTEAQLPVLEAQRLAK